MLQKYLHQFLDACETPHEWVPEPAVYRFSLVKKWHHPNGTCVALYQNNQEFVFYLAVDSILVGLQQYHLTTHTGEHLVKIAFGSARFLQEYDSEHLFHMLQKGIDLNGRKRWHLFDLQMAKIALRYTSQPHVIIAMGGDIIPCNEDGSYLISRFYTQPYPEVCESWHRLAPSIFRFQVQNNIIEHAVPIHRWQINLPQSAHGLMEMEHALLKIFDDLGGEPPPSLSA